MTSLPTCENIEQQSASGVKIHIFGRDVAAPSCCFCFCLSPKIGTIIIGILEMIQSVALPGFFLYAYFNFIVPLSVGKTMTNVLFGEELNEMGMTSSIFGSVDQVVDADDHKEIPISKIVLAIGVILFIIRFGFGILLIFGTFRKSALILKIWLLSKIGLFIAFIIEDLVIAEDLKRAKLVYQGPGQDKILLIYIFSQIQAFAIAAHFLFIVFAHFQQLQVQVKMDSNSHSNSTSIWNCCQSKNHKKSGQNSYQQSRKSVQRDCDTDDGHDEVTSYF